MPEGYLSERTSKTSSCWLWTLSANSAGYGNAHVDGKYILAHRLAWIEAFGEIPDGLTVDHRCRTRMCVNPMHLRLLTNEANGRDNAQVHRTKCPAGHPYDDFNTYVDPRGHRRCRECARNRAAA